MIPPIDPDMLVSLGELSELLGYKTADGARRLFRAGLKPVGRGPRGYIFRWGDVLEHLRERVDVRAPMAREIRDSQRPPRPPREPRKRKSATAAERDAYCNPHLGPPLTKREIQRRSNIASWNRLRVGRGMPALELHEDARAVERALAAERAEREREEAEARRLANLDPHLGPPLTPEEAERRRLRALANRIRERNDAPLIDAHGTKW